MDVVQQITLAAGGSFNSAQIDLPAISGRVYQINGFEVHTRSLNTAAADPSAIVAMSSDCGRTSLSVVSGESLDPDVLGSFMFDSSQYACEQAGGIETRQSLIDQPVFTSSCLLMLATGSAGVTAGGTIYANVRLSVDTVKLTNDLMQLMVGRHSGCS